VVTGGLPPGLGSCQATHATSPLCERRAAAPVVASRKAPVPKVHLASPASRQASANSAACWSTARPTTGTSGPNVVVLPTGWAQVTISGSSSSSTPKSWVASGAQATRSRSRSNEREAVAASVTNAPHSRWSSQASVVVATPSRVTFSRSQAIFGATK
jgi:hypothetical protein